MIQIFQKRTSSYFEHFTISPASQPKYRSNQYPVQSISMKMYCISNYLTDSVTIMGDLK